MQTSTAFAPSPNPGLQPDSFAAFLTRLAELPDWDSDPAVEPFGTYASSEPAEAGEEDLASLSYEQALRTPTHKGNKTGKSQPSKSSPKTALAVQPSPKALEPKAFEPKPFESSPFELPKSLEIRPFEIVEPRLARTTVRFTAGEHKLLNKRAAENNIAVSAYVRSCVLEVESLRAQIQQFQQFMTQQLMPQERMSEPRSSSASQPTYSATELQMPTIAAPAPQPILPAPQPPRAPMQPLTARAPQPVSTLRLDPRIQAAFDAQKRISAQPSPAPHLEKKRTGLFSFLFASRRSA